MAIDLNLYNPDKVKYVVWSFDDGVEINIDGNELVYCQLGKTHHGCQCNHNGDNPKHRLIQRKLKEVTELFRDIEVLNEI